MEQSDGQAALSLCVCVCVRVKKVFSSDEDVIVRFFWFSLVEPHQNSLNDEKHRTGFHQRMKHLDPSANAMDQKDIYFVI